MFFLVNPLLLLSLSFPTMSHGVAAEEGEGQALYHRRRSLATSIPLRHSHPLPHNRYVMWSVNPVQFIMVLSFFQYGGASLPPAYPGPPSQPPPPANPGLPYVS